ncbi:hypothetical protein [Marivita sp. GX14005]|uniref:hypothetical protein n=1 Tax=Marivita sp. GX14005 TaxID=2942276 RepID=UPI00201883DA|nr:hypothetical protein [Marivita sp. GX14005]MCL3883619.1 hypothetical protein [Marivita sp. GX14005]
MPRFLFLILALPALAACQHYDKAAHFAAGAAVSHAVTTQTDNKALGCAAAVGVGILKELIDDVADPMDAVATGLGCSVALAF